MDPPPPHSLLEDRKTKSFAEVAEPLWGDPTFREVLVSFRKFLSLQEIAKLFKDQLVLFRALSVLVIETSAKSVSDGEDVSGVLAASVNILDTVSSHLKTTEGLDNVVENPNQLSDMESNIREGFEGLETQLRKLPQAKFEVIVYNDEFIKARQRDRAKIEELAAIVKQMTPQSGGSFDPIIESLMGERLMIIRDPTLGQEQTSAKRALAVLVELTGKSLPPSTILGKEFIMIGHQAIHQGASYDIFVGEYFTGEKIAVKQLRHRVDEETAKKTHERFARQALNWSTLRHDAILSFYGMGVAPSPFFPGDFQL
ncbi:hypothetical protein FRC12_001098 [Ceratobasidium sp. 428]|nr:hypothetical protein FRC12_001098 [Ceratobasidium sp. 428]